MRDVDTKYKEIFRLARMLVKAKIVFTIHALLGGFQIDEVEGCPDFDVVEHDGSYGRDADLLEIMGLLTEKELKSDSVKGYLTAENVFARIKKARKKELAKERAEYIRKFWGG